MLEGDKDCDECIWDQKCKTFPYCGDNYTPHSEACPICGRESMSKILEDLADDCPNYDSCTETAIENYEPMHDESRD